MKFKICIDERDMFILYRKEWLFGKWIYVTQSPNPAWLRKQARYVKQLINYEVFKI